MEFSPKSSELYTLLEGRINKFFSNFLNRRQRTRPTGIDNVRPLTYPNTTLRVGLSTGFDRLVGIDMTGLAMANLDRSENTATCSGGQARLDLC